MDGTAIDIIFFGALAPILGVILFWFIQLLFIESQKYFLSIIKKKHEALIKFSNFLGILFQTICHALGYTVTRSGISKFYISVNYGKVSPKKIRRGVLEWSSNIFLIIGPFFFPGIILLICLFFLIDSSYFTIYQQGLTFSDNLINLGLNTYNFSNGFLNFIFNIDLFHPFHLGFLILLIIMGLGIRPSFISEEKYQKVDMLFDLKNIRYKILHKPLYIFLLFLISYVLFYISVLINRNFYIAFFSILGWLSIISIISLVITHLILIFINFSDKLEYYYKISIYISLPLLYILFRIIFYYFPINISNGLSLIFTILIVALLIYYLLKKKENTFKKQFNISYLSKLGKGSKDESRRIIRK
jgi:hypothetical protein